MYTPQRNLSALLPRRDDGRTELTHSDYTVTIINSGYVRIIDISGI